MKRKKKLKLNSKIAVFVEKIEIHNSENEAFFRYWCRCISPEIMPSPKIPLPSPGNAWMFFESNEMFMPTTKNMQQSKLLSHIWLVCGNEHVLITIFSWQRNDVLSSGWIYLSSTWRDESEYIHCDANRSKFVKTKIFLLHFRYEEFWYCQKFIIRYAWHKNQRDFVKTIFLYHY